MSREGVSALVGRGASSAGVDPSAPPAATPLAAACSAALPVNVPMRRTSPAGWRQRPRGMEWHEGLDLVAAVGDPVYAVRAGRVVLATDDGARGFRGYGRSVVIYHGPSGPEGAAVGLDPARAIFAIYAHNDALLVMSGEVVAAGQQIARAGRSSGGAFPGMGAHVHIGCRYAKDNGASPWPGPYPHPVRAPLQLAKSWVDAEKWLSAWGIIPATDARATSYVVLAGSAADCPRVPRSIIRGVSPATTHAASYPLSELPEGAEHQTGPAAPEATAGEGGASTLAPIVGAGVAGAIGLAAAIVASRKAGR